MIVADASVVVDLLLGGGSEAGDTLAAHLRSGEVICAPHLIDVEVGQVISRFALRGEIRQEDAEALILDFTYLSIRRYPHTGLLSRAFSLRLTVYDGIYLALAEALGCPLLTGDQRLAGVPDCGAEVTVVMTSAGE